MLDFEQVARIIERNPDVAVFGEKGQGVSRQWIDEAERMLGVVLPPSYRWWLENYRGGEICGEEIYTVFEKETGSLTGGGDIRYLHQVHQKSGLRQPREIAICHSDVDGDFFFDAAAGAPDHEYPVIAAATGKVYAANFLEFLVERIKICGGEV